VLAVAYSPSLPQIAVMATGADPFLVLLNYGGLGILALLFITGRVSSKPEVDYLKKQLDSRDKLIDDLRVQLTERTIPALTRVGQVMAEYPHQVAPPDPALRRTLEDLVARIEQLDR
jgi:hypothetical protein